MPGSSWGQLVSCSSSGSLPRSAPSVIGGSVTTLRGEERRHASSHGRRGIRARRPRAPGRGEPASGLLAPPPGDVSGGKSRPRCAVFVCAAARAPICRCTSGCLRGVPQPRPQAVPALGYDGQCSVPLSGVRPPGAPARLALLLIPLGTVTMSSARPSRRKTDLKLIFAYTTCPLGSSSEYGLAAGAGRRLRHLGQTQI